MRKTSKAQKQVMGTYRADRDRPSPAFGPSKGLARKAPDYVKQNAVALKEWKRVAPLLEKEGILKATDVAMLASYCVIFSRWRSAADDIEQRGQTLIVTSTTRTGRADRPIVNPSVRTEIAYQQQLLKLMVKLGLNPIDRSRVEASPFEDKQPTDDFDAEWEAQYQ